MIGIDTNVLVRYIMQEDSKQTVIANIFLESLASDNPGFVTLVTVAEVGWVLLRRYKLTRDEFYKVMGRLVNSAELCFESESLVSDALLTFQRTNADFGDCLVFTCAQAAGCESTVTFDRDAARILGMRLLT